MKTVRWMAVALVLPVAGCQITTFQNAPVAELACDARLAGDWLSAADPGHNDAAGELELRIDKSCSLSIIEHNRDGAKRHEPMPLHVGRDGAQDYAWLDYNSLSQSMSGHGPTSKPAPDSDDPVVPAGDLYVLRYSANEQELQVQHIDTTAVAHRIIDGKLSGDITKKGYTLFNRLTDKVSPEQLRNDVVFDPELLRFTRRNGEPAK